MTGSPVTKADGCDVAEVGEGVGIDVRDAQRNDLEHVDVAEVYKGALLDVRHCAVMDENAQEAAHAAEGATVDAVELAIDDGERRLVHPSGEVVEGELSHGAHLNGVQGDAYDVGQGREGV